jgi:hypothetical protein
LFLFTLMSSWNTAVKTKARALLDLAIGLPPLDFELSFEDGFDEAREWLEPRQRKSWNVFARESRKKHKAA